MLLFYQSLSFKNSLTSKEIDFQNKQQILQDRKYNQAHRMYSSLKNHSNNLQYCERFYNNAYEYYNDYQKPEDYEDDLGKLFFKCKRKTIATLWCYSNPNNQSYAQNRSIRFLQEDFNSQGRISTSSMEIQGNNQEGMKQEPKSFTMEDFLNGFIEIFHQNNFSDFKNDLQQNKNKHKIVYFPQQRVLKNKASSQRGKNFNLQLDFIQHLMDGFDTKIKNIKKLYEDDKIDVNQMSFYACQLAFQSLNQFELESLLKNKQEGTKIISIYNLFKTMIQNLLDEMCDSQSWSHLILYIPKLPILNYYFNPLISGIYTFLRKQESLSKSDYHKTQQAERQLPKIVLINLDGRQTPQNIRTVNECSPIGLMYITIYNESLHHEEIQDQQDQISEMISQLIIKEIDKANKGATQDKRNKGKNYTQVPKVFAFPLNSKHIKNVMRQKHGNDSEINCTLSGSSQDIMFLFDNVLFEEIRNFCPNIIMINYNGALHINQQDFTKIIRTLTIISDHRIVLFPNFCNLFQKSQESSIKIPTEEFIQEKQLNEETLLKVKSYIEKYQQIDLNQIDIHNFFNNMAMFLKISSGTYSFQQRHYTPSAIFQKYQTGLKYEYLERLAELEEFKYYSKFISKHLKGSSLMKLMERERRECIQKNYDNAPLYKALLDQAVQQLWSQSDKIPKNIKYKLKKICRSFDDKQQKLENYFEIKKDRLLIETIKSQKIKKAYYVKSSHRQGQPDNLYVYTFRQNSQERSEIFLQHYSQVIFQQYGDKALNVFVINARDDNDRLKMMFGQTRINGYEVYLSPVMQDFREVQKKFTHISLQQIQENTQLEYVNYSYTFYKNILYLFWPYEWDIKLQAQTLMVGLQYTPKIVNKMLRVTVQTKQNKLQVYYKSIDYIAKTDFIPRLQAGGFAISQQKIFVFGGICDDKRDFQLIDSGAFVLTVKNDQFWAENIPKQYNRTKIRPKLNYVIEQKDQNTLSISGGHGRQFTNFFNVFSYHSYDFNINSYEITPKKGNRKVIQLPKPMFTRKQGRFDMAKDRGSASNSVKIQQRLSNQPKYKFILCRKGFYSQKDTNKNSAITFLDDDYTTTIYNKESSFSHIFSSNKIFENIYSQRYCSPEIYVWDRSRDLIRIQILVEVSKQVNEYSMKEFIFPNQDSLIAFCIHSSHQKIYLLAKSAIYTRNAYILYEGSLKNSDVIASEKQFKMRIFFQFKPNIHKLQLKSIYSQDHRLMICGGNLNNYGVREDYLLERIKGKYKLKTIKLSYPTKPLALQVPNPYILQTLQEGFLMYTVCLNSEQKWVVKLQQFTLNNNKRIIKQSQINLNTIYQGRIFKINPNLMKLNFLNISRYSRFSFEYFRGKVHALLIEMNKLQEQIDLNEVQEQIKHKVLIFVLKNSYQTIQTKISYIYTQFKRFISYIIKQKSEDSFYIEKSMLAWQIILILVNYKIQQGFYSSFSQQQRKKMETVDLYRFILEDKSRPLVKYVALSDLNTTKLAFFQIKTRRPIVSSMVSNMSGEDQYGINIIDKNCNQIYFDQMANYKNQILFQRTGKWEDSIQLKYQVQSETFRSNEG